MSATRVASVKRPTAGTPKTAAPKSYRIGKGRRATLRLEGPFLRALDRICASDGIDVGTFLARVEAGKNGISFSSAVRCAILAWHEAALAGTAPPKRRR